jgi:hypothetical protein
MTIGLPLLPAIRAVEDEIYRALRFDERGSTMLLADTLISIWQQVLAEGRSTVDLEGRTYGVGRTRAKRLRTVRFGYADYGLDGIEQNPATTSQWAALAREGKRIMQFSCRNRYVANVCEGELTRYPAWYALRLPE